MMRPFLATLLLPLTGCCFVSCNYPEVWVEKTTEARFAPGEVDRIRCETHNGAIQVSEDADRSEILVTTRIRGGGRDEIDAQHALDAIEVTCDARDGELDLRWSWRTEESGWGAEVAFEVVLPGAVPIRADTHNGSIRVTATGASALTTHNGAIEVDGTVTDLSVTTHNGAIAASGPFVALDAESHNGGVHVRRTAGGQIDGSVVTHNGGVLVELAPEADATVRCSTDNGSIRVQTQMNDSSAGDGYAAGKLGAGRGDLRITTHNGDIVLRPAS